MVCANNYPSDVGQINTGCVDGTIKSVKLHRMMFLNLYFWGRLHLVNRFLLPEVSQGLIPGSQWLLRKSILIQARGVSLFIPRKATEMFNWHWVHKDHATATNQLTLFVYVMWRVSLPIPRLSANTLCLTYFNWIDFAEGSKCGAFPTLSSISMITLIALGVQFFLSFGRNV